MWQGGWEREEVISLFLIFLTKVGNTLRAGYVGSRPGKSFLFSESLSMVELEGPMQRMRPLGERKAFTARSSSQQTKPPGHF